MVHVLYRNRGSARWLIKLSLTHFYCERPWQHCSFCNLSTGPEEVFKKNVKPHTVSQFQTAANYRNCFHHNPGKSGMPICPHFMTTESGQHICHPIIPAHIRNLMSRRVTRNSKKVYKRNTVGIRFSFVDEMLETVAGKTRLGGPQSRTGRARKDFAL